MTVLLQIVLIAGSFLTFLYIIYRIRKAQFQIQDSIFWVLVFLLLFVIGVFPYIVYNLADLLGIYSPINLVLVAVIFVLIVKVFFQSFQISQMESKIKDLARRIALDEHERLKKDNKKDAG